MIWEKTAIIVSVMVRQFLQGLSVKMNNKTNAFYLTKAESQDAINVEIKLTYKIVYKHRVVVYGFNVNRPVICPVKALQQR